MRSILAALSCMMVVAEVTRAQAPLAPQIENPTGKYLVWGDYKIEVNQYGGLGRNWPTPGLVWQQYDLLREKAKANPEPPNTLRAILLILPTTEATAVKCENGKEIVVGQKTTSMTSAEVKWQIEQWREFEEMIYVYSGGNAWLRTDIKVIDEPIQVKTDENWVFWAGRQRELLDRYVPFERGDYQGYTSIYCSKGLRASPHGGTIGAVGGIKGCGTSDNAFYGRGKRIDERTGYVALHEWLNQQCSATSNMMPYPDKETLWNNYVLPKIGYREDIELNAWPWLSLRRDTMMHIIRPGMWRRWTAIDPYISRAIGQWMMFGPTEGGKARALTTAPDSEGKFLEMPMDKYTQFNLSSARASSEDAPEMGRGTYYFRTYVQADERKEVRLWAAADERFQLWLNGIMIRDGWGWNYSEDDGKLFEKVTYATLEQGVNTLVLVLPNEKFPVEFRVRLCDTDGSGRSPAGVTTFPRLRERQPVPLGEPVVPDFKNPRLYKWADINDQPWLKMPRLDEAALRDLTGIDTLRIRTNGKPRKDDKGREYEPPQHLFFDVPQDAVTSPWIPEPAEDDARLNNDFDYNWKSLAWLRVPGRPGPEKDVLFLRFDVAEPLMHLLMTSGRPAHESIAGWVLVEHKLAYVVVVKLDIDQVPETPLGLLSRQPS
jgi:hypothetical protein